MQTPERTYTDSLPLEAYIPYAERMARGDEDLRQELFLAAFYTIRRGYTYPARVIHSMQMARIAYHRGWGKSIDNGNPYRRPRGSLFPTTYDGAETKDPTLVAYCSRTTNPETIALFRISFERFCSALSPLERRYMDMQLAGLAVCDRNPALSRYMVTRVRKGLRKKFFELIEDDGKGEVEEEF